MPHRSIFCPLQPAGPVVKPTKKSSYLVKSRLLKSCNYPPIAQVPFPVIKNPKSNDNNYIFGLPPEIFHMITEELEYSDLAQLALTSKRSLSLYLSAPSDYDKQYSFIGVLYHRESRWYPEHYLAGDLVRAGIISGVIPSVDSLICEENECQPARHNRDPECPALVPTPLFYALKYGDRMTAEWLLERGANWQIIFPHIFDERNAMFRGVPQVILWIYSEFCDVRTLELLLNLGCRDGFELAVEWATTLDEDKSQDEREWSEAVLRFRYDDIRNRVLASCGFGDWNDLREGFDFELSIPSDTPYENCGNYEPHDCLGYHELDGDAFSDHGYHSGSGGESEIENIHINAVAKVDNGEGNIGKSNAGEREDPPTEAQVEINKA